MFTIFIFSCAVAGFVMLWTNLREDVAFLARCIDSLPFILRKPLTCNLCFTFWTVFFVLFFINPIPPLSFLSNFNGYGHSFLFFLISWMSLGFTSNTMRGLGMLIGFTLHRLDFLNKDSKH